MHPPILSDGIGSVRPTMPNPLTFLIIAILWLTFACALPLHQLREARRQAQQDLQHLLAAEKPDSAGVIAAFDRSNQNLDAAASASCLVLAVTILFLVNQMFRFKRRYNALARELSAPGSREGDWRAPSEN